MKKRRRNDAPWRRACMAARGPWCRSCGTTRDLECDHIRERSQQGPSVVQNGLILCRGCHDDKTNGRIKVDPAWLDEDQVAWLAETGWVSWDPDGEPRGEGMKGFARRRGAPGIVA